MSSPAGLILTRDAQVVDRLLKVRASLMGLGAIAAVPLAELDAVIARLMWVTVRDYNSRRIEASNTTLAEVIGDDDGELAHVIEQFSHRDFPGFALAGGGAAPAYRIEQVRA